LRDSQSGIDFRVDFLDQRRDGSDFPFDPVAIEVKRSDAVYGAYILALKQCVDYRGCVVVDQRLPSLKGIAVPAVFLWRGQWMKGPTSRGGAGTVQPGFRDGAIRMAGKSNVGEIVHHIYQGMRFEISDTPLWSALGGLTGAWFHLAGGTQDRPR
jgi:hypothetical protein